MTETSEPIDVTRAVEVIGASMVFNDGTPARVAALNDVDLVVETGDFVSLIGPSGCGKSTLLRLIANLLDPTAGDVRVNGKPAAQARLDQDYGMAFQKSGLFEWRLGREEHRASARVEGLGQASVARNGSAEMLDLVQLLRVAARPSPVGVVRRSCSSGSRSRGRWPRIHRCC